MHYVKSHKSELTILSLSLLLLIVNFTPFAFLTGWDSLQTELNPALGVKRAFFSVWEEYQSMGLVAGMGHAADLVRSVIIFGLSLLLPDWSIRYVFHMSMIPIAGLGMLKLLQLCGFNHAKKGFALVGALFYIFNFAVIQMLYLPYESFSIFFGTLPWMVWVFLKMVDSKTGVWHEPKLLLLFILINFLSTSSFQAQQLFVVYILLLGALTLGILISYLPSFWLVQNRFWSRVAPQNDKIVSNLLLNTIFAFILIAVVNSFWLAPQAYFLFDNGSVVKEAKMNQLVTDDVLYSNKDKGSLTDFLSFTGFFYDRLGGQQQPLFAPWKQHRESVVIIFVIATLAAIMLLGVFQSSKFRWGFFVAFVLIMVGLLLHTPPFEQINTLLRSHPFINQIFRSPFTKFSIPYALIASYFFASGVYFISKHTPRATRIVLVIAAGLVLLSALPAFTGNYIAKDMRVGIPKPYFSLMRYLRTQSPNHRIAMLPDYTFWGWFYNDWGYNGSGFLWYGIEQPIISRTFDVWSKTSESYYWEIKQATESENAAAFEAVLNKYDVDYILYDTSLSPVVSSTKAIQYDRLDAMLAKSPHIQLEKRWEFLSLYRVNKTEKATNFVQLMQDVPNIGPLSPVTNSDATYARYGTYQTNTMHAYTAYYPFSDLMTQTSLPHKQWKLTETSDTFVLNSTVSLNMSHYELSTTSGVLTQNLYNRGQAVQFFLPYTVEKTPKSVVVTFPKVLLDDFRGSMATVKPCPGTGGTIRTDKTKGRLTVNSQNGASACFSFTDSFLDQRFGYIVRVKNQNSLGQRLFFYVLDETKEQPYLEDRLRGNTDYYVIGSKYDQGFGYSFSFQNTSYPTISSVNTLERVAVYLLPYDLLKQLELENTTISPTKATPVPGITVTHPTYDRYDVTVPVRSVPTTLILNQSFDPGWVAYEVSCHPELVSGSFCHSGLSRIFPFLFGSKINDHVLINNWANGWNLPYTLDAKPYTLVIIFWPQYLQYLGFAVLISVVAIASLPLLFFKAK